MAEFTNADLTGSRFTQVDLTGAIFSDLNMAGVQIRGALLDGVDLSGDFDTLIVNGVDVAPFVDAELNRRYPERVKMRPTDAEGFREAWSILTGLWAQTVERTRGFTPEQLHERVDEEWSFIETLRHLVFATDAWVLRAYLGNPSPYDPLDLPNSEMGDLPGVPHDSGARPSLDEVLALRADRMATVSRVLATLTDEELAGETTPVTEPGYPESEAFARRRCLGAIINEEWEHRLFAERDLTTLDERSSLTS